MMANWEQLNSKFNNIIDNMSNNDWNKWASERIDRKAMRSSEMMLKAKLQEQKILLSNKIGAPILTQTGHSSTVNNISNSVFFGLVPKADPIYADAA